MKNSIGGRGQWGFAPTHCGAYSVPKLPIIPVSWNNGWKQLGQLIWIYYHFLNGTGLDLNLHNSSWI